MSDSTAPPPGRKARLRSTAQRYAIRLEPTAVGRLWSGLLEVEFVDRSVALAAKAFVSFFPLLIVVAVIAPSNVRADLLDTIATRFGVSGSAFDTVRQAFSGASATREATGIFGVVLALAYATSFTTALQRIYLRAWRRPSGGGARNRGRGAAWLGGVLVLILLFTAIRAVLVGPQGTVLSVVFGVIGSILLWWWTARLMLRGEVRWRALLPTAVVTGVGMWAYTLSAAIWMPATVTKQFAQFGAFGIALAFVTWFTGFAFLVVIAAVIGPAAWDGEDQVGRWLRRGGDSALEPSAAPALPGPARTLRLTDAFARGDDGGEVDLGGATAPQRPSDD